MLTRYRWAGLSILLCLSTLTAREPFFTQAKASENEVHITIIYDNYQDVKSLETDWGFACLVEYMGNQLLFDAGRSADLYKKNMEILQINPKDIPCLFISHEHGDHTAGMPWITSVNPSVKCYRPANSIGMSEPAHLYGPFYSTGDNFKSFKEQGLVIKTQKGGVLLTGCGHPGAIEMIEVANEELGIEIHTLIGGLHLMRSSDNELSQIASKLKDMGIQQICPTHCTGDHSIAYFAEFFGEGYISGGTGKKIVIK
jgi:7,8-dihydropterin-6-yl-methyl-4-(beta-D-ribofuranosyl)aminobenzene 5'-phosphate synthase